MQTTDLTHSFWLFYEFNDSATTRALILSGQLVFVACSPAFMTLGRILHRFVNSIQLATKLRWSWTCGSVFVGLMVGKNGCYLIPSTTTS